MPLLSSSFTKFSLSFAITFGSRAVLATNSVIMEKWLHVPGTQRPLWKWKGVGQSQRLAGSPLPMVLCKVILLCESVGVSTAGLEEPPKAVLSALRFLPGTLVSSWSCYPLNSIAFKSSNPLHLLPKDFPGGSDGTESVCNVGNPGLIPGS